jgi:mRNA interferase HigB
VKVLGERLLTDFAQKHATARKPLGRFLEIARAATWKHMPDVKATLASADFDADAQTFIFDIGGNKYRLLASIDFTEQMMVIEEVMTHEQYNRR